MSTKVKAILVIAAITLLIVVVIVGYMLIFGGVTPSQS